jgi:hypothetical protein
MSEPFRILTLTAFIATEKETGEEGILASLNAQTGVWMPMIGADEARVTALMPTAAALAKTLGIKVTLARFSVREDLKQLDTGGN